MILLQIQQPIESLMKLGTIGGIFLATLLLTNVMLVSWAKKFIADTLRQKDDRITALEITVANLTSLYHKELLVIIADTQKMMQKNTDAFDKNTDAFERIENILKEINRKQ